MIVCKTRSGLDHEITHNVSRRGAVGRLLHAVACLGEYHAVEGDVLYAAPMSWHQMSAEAPSGPSVRLAMGGYPLINMGNTEGQ
jgi:hypothetical protein